MPQQRVKRKYKDISMSFENNPLNDDLVSLSDTSAIARSLRNIVFTQPGEKFFNPDFGSRITESLFENVDEVSGLAIEDEIKILQSCFSETFLIALCTDFRLPVP